MQYRQGDVLIERVSEGKLPKSAKPIPKDRGRVILAYGEATGHAHIVEGEDVELLGAKPGDDSPMALRYLVVKGEGATVKHDEHDSIWLRPGVHKITRQREYVPTASEERSTAGEPMRNFRPVYD